jgi:hypothetical protein
MDIASFEQAVSNNLRYLKRLPEERTFRFGTEIYSRNHMIESQDTLLGLIKTIKDPGRLRNEIKKQFNLYRAAGRLTSKKCSSQGILNPYMMQESPRMMCINTLYTACLMIL